MPTIPLRVVTFAGNATYVPVEGGAEQVDELCGVDVAFAEVKNNFSKVTAKVNRTGRPVTVLKNNRLWVVIQPATQAAEGGAVDVAVDFMDEYADVFRELAK